MPKRRVRKNSAYTILYIITILLWVISFTLLLAIIGLIDIPSNILLSPEEQSEQDPSKALLISFAVVLFLSLLGNFIIRITNRKEIEENKQKEKLITKDKNGVNKEDRIIAMHRK